MRAEIHVGPEPDPVLQVKDPQGHSPDINHPVTPGREISLAGNNQGAGKVGHVNGSERRGRRGVKAPKRLRPRCQPPPVPARMLAAMLAPVAAPLPSKPAPRRRVLVVLGMHRGGTSAVAGMLQRLGVDFGPRLMPANADNPAGYYEHNDVVNLHDRFLGRLGAAWDDPFPPAFEPSSWSELAPAPGLPTYRQELLSILKRDFSGEDGRPPAPLWGLKDPRLCLLLPWWEPLWTELDSEPRFILVLRGPEAVAASLGRRDGF